ncbi:MAG: hypothetical protein QNJ97_02420 [Myxococcota bacterium]|nr:hypothetical protein [Myxococcota bacterium]
MAKSHVAVFGLCVVFSAAIPRAAAGTSPGSSIVLVSLRTCCPNQTWPEVEKSVLEEFVALGVPVETVDGVYGTEEAQHSQMTAIAEKSKATCVISISRRVENPFKEADLWMTHPETGEITTRRLGLTGNTDSERVAIAALQAVEAIRAALFEQPRPQMSDKPTQQAPAPEPPKLLTHEPHPAARDIRQATAHHPSIGLGVGMGASGAPGGAGILGSAVAAITWHPLALFSMEIDGSLSLLGRDIETDRSTSSFRYALVRGWAYAELLNAGLFRPSVGIGGGALFAWSEGQSASIEYAEKKDITSVALVGATGRMGLVLSQYFWIRAGIRASVCLPEVTVYFAGAPVARFGKPLIEGFLNLEVALFQ